VRARDVTARACAALGSPATVSICPYRPHLQRHGFGPIEITTSVWFVSIMHRGAFERNTPGGWLEDGVPGGLVRSSVDSREFEN
jgi:hypothetical protein